LSDKGVGSYQVQVFKDEEMLVLNLIKLVQKDEEMLVYQIIYQMVSDEEMLVHLNLAIG